jgi:molybdate transport system substrate-binding protein
MHTPIRLCLLALGLAQASLAAADDVLVAVAASLMPPMIPIAADFERTTGHTVELATGSTGALYAQAANGAPFDIFVAADSERPRRLAESGLGIPATRATVAIGRLVLFSRDTARIEDGGLDALRDETIRHVAIANPRVAPYGLAAQQTLEALDLWAPLSARVVRGESVAQTFAMIATGNAELGLVALAQVIGLEPDEGAWVIVPERLHAPIEQDAIVLSRARDHTAAQAFHAWLFSAGARTTLESFGYETVRD